MIRGEQVLVLDIDGTMCHLIGPTDAYADAEPVTDMVERVRSMHADGWYIIFNTSRRMRSLEGNVGAITAKVVPELVDWLQRHDIPFDEIHVGKPWAGRDGIYVDDRAVRPDEFLEMSEQQIIDMAAP